MGGPCEQCSWSHHSDLEEEGNPNQTTHHQIDESMDERRIDGCYLGGKNLEGDGERSKSVSGPSGNGEWHGDGEGPEWGQGDPSGHGEWRRNGEGLGQHAAAARSRETGAAAVGNRGERLNGLA